MAGRGKQGPADLASIHRWLGLSRSGWADGAVVGCVGVGDRLASLPGRSTWSSVVPVPAGVVRSSRAGGGPQTRVNRSVQAVSQGQAVGRCRVSRRAEDAIRAGTVISLRRMVAVVALARLGAGDGGGGAGEVERHHGEHQPGGVRGELPRGQVRQGGVLQVGVDLLDDRVAAVGLVRGHGVGHARGRWW